MEAPVLVALISSAVSLVTSGVTAILIAERRGAVDKKIASLKGKLDEDITNLKARLDQRALFQAERVALELMQQPDWSLRSFSAFKRHIGGWSDDELRQILIRAGGLRFAKIDQGEDPDKNELWGLLDRNRERLRGNRLSGDEDKGRVVIS